MILTGKEVSNKILEELKNKSQTLVAAGITPTLAMIRVGSDPSDEAYLRSIELKCARAGVKTEICAFGASADASEILNCVLKLNEDTAVHGILVFRPLKDKNLEKKIAGIIDIKKDVDLMRIYDDINNSCNNSNGLGFYPCTPEAVMAMLDYYNIKLEGKKIAVIGRSSVVGKPVADLLSQRGAIVTVCHSQTKDMPVVLKTSEIIISAAGCAGLVDSTMVSTGQTVIDVGINEIANGKITGDVDFEKVSKIVENITPVPGGVGSVTSAILCSHVIKAAENNLKLC